MNRCQKCNVIILDDTDRCPLCQHVLQSDGGMAENAYPNAIAVTKRFRFWENLFLFLSILVESLLVWINYSVNPEVAWSLVVGLILIYANAVFRMAVVGKSGYMFKTLTLVILAIVMLLGIDYLTGYRRWSLDYVLPCGVLALDLVLIILMLVNRRNWQSYMMPQLFTILLSLIPVILRVMGVIQFPYLVWIALAASVFLFLGTLILGDQRARTELKRRFHI
ncbi:MAG: DUF6320 domain-containing protein [Lachnospiraceae bacterium]|nr:DUF6320 domain-containing protein [Agathobacter sp.]MDD6291800.1 DUF6320 domain-containing protein [Lachnospiraceae bacterium]